MTTIAYKDGVIAYDSRATRGGTVVDDDRSKMTIIEGIRIFAAGAPADIGKLVEAYFGRGVAQNIDAHAFVVIGNVLEEVGVDNRDGFWKVPIQPGNPRAIGSGSHFALAAMDMGATAEEAIRAAMKRDVYTGGRVRTFTLEVQPWA